MQPELDTAADNPMGPAYLMITDPAAQTSTVALETNCSLFAGSGPNCRIFLDGEDVHPIHCMLWLDEKRVLRVQDWNTGGKTRLNERPVNEETVLNSGDRLEIGSNLIVPVLSDKVHARVANEIAVIEETSLPTKQPIAHEPSQPIEFEIAEACDDGEVSVETYAYNFDADIESESSEYYEFNAQNSVGQESLIDEDVESLRIEVEQLRFDVAERDAQLRMLREQTPDQQEPDYEDDDQTIRLVNRLEELLGEIQTSDDRVRGLEELLRVSDQATQAEREERQQLESWVTEIEQRVSQREAETAAEMKRLVGRLREAQAQHKHVAAQLQNALRATDNGPSNSAAGLVEKFSEQIADLQKRLEAANAENEKLRTQNLHDESTSKAEHERQKLEQKLLELQVESSRERADLARQRVQLERLKDELEQKLNSPEKGDADSRIEAMRRHLQEIHDQEQLEREEKKQRGLSGRISRLLSRVGQ